MLRTVGLRDGAKSVSCTLMQSPTSTDSSPRWSWPLAAASETPTKRPKHARTFRSNRLRDGAALALTAVLSLTGFGAASAANQITGSIATVDVEAVFQDFYRETEHERPTLVIPDESIGANQPLNILLLGVDGRYADNSLYGGAADVAGARSDTTLVMHISADRQHVTSISIPRDSMVNIPSCPTTTPGRSTPARTNVRFNSAFAMGFDIGGDVQSGALCTMTAVESLTNVRLDGFVVLDFAGFENMVEALGGLEICIPNAINAPKAEGLSLDAGCHHLSGFETLQLSRARIGQGLGDGSDLSRISRQQNIMQAMANQALRNGFLTDPIVMLRFLNRTTESMTASSNLASVMGLAGLAGSLGSINPDNIDFRMVPIADNPNDRNTVIWTRAADELWRNIRYNTLYGDETEATSSPDAGDADTADAADTVSSTTGS